MQTPQLICNNITVIASSNFSKKKIDKYTDNVQWSNYLICRAVPILETSLYLCHARNTVLKVFPHIYNLHFIDITKIESNWHILKLLKKSLFNHQKFNEITNSKSLLFFSFLDIKEGLSEPLNSIFDFIRFLNLKYGLKKAYSLLLSKLLSTNKFDVFFHQKKISQINVLHSKTNTFFQLTIFLVIPIALYRTNPKLLLQPKAYHLNYILGGSTTNLLFEQSLQYRHPSFFRIKFDKILNYNSPLYSNLNLDQEKFQNIYFGLPSYFKKYICLNKNQYDFSTFTNLLCLHDFLKDKSKEKFYQFYQKLIFSRINYCDLQRIISLYKLALVDKHLKIQSFMRNKEWNISPIVLTPSIKIANSTLNKKNPGLSKFLINLKTWHKFYYKRLNYKPQSIYINYKYCEYINQFVMNLLTPNVLIKDIKYSETLRNWDKFKHISQINSIGNQLDSIFFLNYKIYNKDLIRHHFSKSQKGMINHISWEEWHLSQKWKQLLIRFNLFPRVYHKFSLTLFPLLKQWLDDNVKLSNYFYKKQIFHLNFSKNNWRYWRYKVREQICFQLSNNQYYNSKLKENILPQVKIKQVSNLSKLIDVSLNFSNQKICKPIFKSILLFNNLDNHINSQYLLLFHSTSFSDIRKNFEKHFELTSQKSSSVYKLNKKYTESFINLNLPLLPYDGTSIFTFHPNSNIIHIHLGKFHTNQNNFNQFKINTVSLLDLFHSNIFQTRIIPIFSKKNDIINQNNRIIFRYLLEETFKYAFNKKFITKQFVSFTNYQRKFFIEDIMNHNSIDNNFIKLLKSKWYIIRKLYINQIQKQNFFLNKKLNQDILRELPTKYISSYLNLSCNINDSIFYLFIRFSDIQTSTSFKSLEIQNKNDLLAISQNKLSYLSRNICVNREQTKNSIKQTPILNSRNIINLNIFWKYHEWAFTYQWWSLIYNTILETLPIVYKDINDNIIYIVYSVIENFTDVWNKHFHGIKFDQNIYSKYFFRYFDQTKTVLEELTQDNLKEKNKWFLFNFYTNLNAKEWLMLGWFFIFYSIYARYISIWRSSSYINLWQKFEKSRFLIEPSWNTRLAILAHNSISSVLQKSYLQSYYYLGFSMWFKSRIYSTFIGQKIISQWLSNITSLDLPQKERGLVIQSLITNKNLYKHKLSSYNNRIMLEATSSLQDIQQPGIYYLRQWTNTYHSYPIQIQFKLDNDIFKWIIASFYKSSALSYNLDLSLSTFKKNKLMIPLPQQSLWDRSKGFLLIGTTESGKSYLVKNLATNSNLPLLSISIERLMYKPNYKAKRWIKKLRDRIRRLELLLELAKKIAPCLIWVPNIHKLSLTYSLNKNQPDTAFLLSLFLKSMTDNVDPTQKKSLTFIGSTSQPNLLDPAFVSPNRLSAIVNLRQRNFLQRQKFFLNMLHNKGLHLRNKISLKEVGYRTMGYNLRDLAGLANETFLISITTNTKIISNNTIRLGLYRNISATVSTNLQIQDYESIHYRLGRVLLETTLLKCSPIFPLSIYQDLWKTRFYYISAAYLESSSDYSTITEFSILTHILNCLSGSAARDAWLIYTQKCQEKTLSLDYQCKHDIDLACNLFQTIFSDFACPHIYVNKYSSVYENLFSKIYSRNNCFIYKNNDLNVMSLPQFSNQLSICIDWSIRLSALSSYHSIMFGKFQKFRQSNYLSLHSNKTEFYSWFSKQRRLEAPYKSIVGENRIQQFENKIQQTVFKESFKNLEELLFYNFIDHEEFRSQILLIGRRPIWKPMLSTHTYLFASRRNLLINDSFLTMLYLNYGTQRERNSISPNRMKRKLLLWRDEKEKTSVCKQISINWENFVSPHTEDIYLFKVMSKSHAQLTRSQLCFPVYLYQNWVHQHIEERLIHFNSISDQNQLFSKYPFVKEGFIYSTLLESYHFMIRFFLAHHNLLNFLEKILLTKKTLSVQDIEKISAKLMS
uniref:Cell division protein n=1 Tax=Netrium digitus TaxID=43946 RepID=A0A191T507_9VIRI|nr:cell division protein [Netrium digitus]ANI25475.1 cell division protein [Netrium digitus]